MSVFHFLGVLITITCLVLLAKRGIVAVVKSFVEGFKKTYNEQTQSTKTWKFTSSKLDRDNPNKIINITVGTCDACGAKFFGTTEDASNIHHIQFLDGEKVLCDDCIAKMQKIFDREDKNGKTHKSATLTDILNQLK